MINYYLLTKPGIILGNLLTVAAGFLLASKGEIHLMLFWATLLGLAFVMASGCVFNNYIDREADKKMSRTKKRALVTGIISGKNAILFAIILGAIGILILLRCTNLLTTVLAGIGFFVYVVLYSMWKRKTIYGTAIGSIAGAIPPLVGYCAVSNQIDTGAVILFAILVLWQMPHFFAIALYHFEDYSAAQIPVLPIIKGALAAKKRMLLYIVGFLGASLMLTVFHYTGIVYLIAAALCGVLWLWLALKGFKSDNDHLWAKQMFRLSLAIITVLCLVIPFDLK